MAIFKGLSAWVYHETGPIDHQLHLWMNLKKWKNENLFDAMSFWVFQTVFDKLYFESYIRITVRRRKLILTQNKLSLILNLDSVKVIWGSNKPFFRVQFRPLDHTVCSILYAAYWMIYTVYIIYHENVDADWKITVQ